MTIMLEGQERSPEDRRENLYRPIEYIFTNPEVVDTFAADMVLDLVREKPNAILILPTGETPKGMYKRIAEESDHGRKIDFSGVTVFNLDEYWPIGRAHPASFTQYMQRHLYDHVNIPKGQRFIPDGQYVRPHLEAMTIQAKLDKFIQLGIPIDLAVLGVGPNGHLGFNEPGTPFDSHTALVSLTGETRQANAAAFADPEDVPHHAITLGLGKHGIRAAKKILLIAKGPSKREALHRAFRGPVTTDVPASVLQLHPNVTLAIDYLAGADLAIGGIPIFGPQTR